MKWNSIETFFLDMDGTILDLAYDDYFWHYHIPALHAAKNKITLNAAKLEFEESTTFSGNDKSVRDSQIKWIDCNPETEWLYEKIYGYAKEANDAIFNFKLYYSKDSIQYSKYDKDGKYDWHIDIGENENNSRKLSCS